MFTVALIGPDGAGKTTVSRRLVESFPLPLVSLYMGMNRDASTQLLPTTRLIGWAKRALGAAPDTAGPRDPRSLSRGSQSWVRRSLKETWLLLGLVNRVAEEWYRQLLAWRYCRRGEIVLFDRDYFSDYYAYDVAPTDQPRSVSRRLHGYLLQRFYPRPQLVICLDAPGEVLFERKGEGTVELLEQRRLDYLQMRELMPHFAVVDATQPEEVVVREITEHLLEFHRARCGAVTLGTP